MKSHQTTLLFFKEPSSETFNKAKDLLLKAKIAILIQHEFLALEINCKDAELISLLKSGLFVESTKDKLGRRELDDLKGKQLDIAHTWNLQKSERPRTKRSIISTDNLSPPILINPERFAKALDAEIKRQDIDTDKLNQNIRIDHDRWSPEYSKLLFDYFLRETRNPNYAHYFVNLYYFSPYSYKLLITGLRLTVLINALDQLIEDEINLKMNLFGALGVFILFVESKKDDGPKFSASTRSNIKSQINNSFNFLSEQHPNGDVSWVTHSEVVLIDKENKEHGNKKYSVYDDYWLHTAIDTLEVFGETYEQYGKENGINLLKVAMAKKYALKKVFVIFITPYGGYHVGYTSVDAKYIVLNESNDWSGYTIENVNHVAAHEILHLFGASDEYIGKNGTPCSSCDTQFGLDKIPHGNCAACNPHVQSCLMQDITPTLCEWTKGQIGWGDFFVEMFTSPGSNTGTTNKTFLDIGDKEFQLKSDTSSIQLAGEHSGYCIWDGGDFSTTEFKRFIIRKEAGGDNWKLERVVIRYKGEIWINNHVDEWITNDRPYLLLQTNFTPEYVNSIKLEVTTSGVNTSGTDDNVCLKLAGRTWNLETEADDFENGKTDTFHLYPGLSFMKDEITDIIIEKSADGFFGGWHLIALTLWINGKIFYVNKGINKWMVDGSLTFKDKI